MINIKESINTDFNWEGEKCRGGCGRNQRIAWSVSDELWNKVTGGLQKVLCLECFLKLCGDKDVIFCYTDFEFLAINGVTFVDKNQSKDL